MTDGQTAEAVALLRDVVEQARRTGDTYNLTMVMAELALALALQGLFDEAIELIEEDVELFRRGRLPWTSQQVMVYGVYGEVLRMAGRPAEAREPCEIALAKSKEVAIFPDIIAMGLVNLARVESELGDDDKARALVDEALSIAAGDEVGEPWPFAVTDAGEGQSWPFAVTKSTAASLAAVRGDTEEAERLAHEALSTSHELGYNYWPQGTTGCLQTIALVAQDAPLAARLWGALDAANERSQRVRPALERSWYDSAIERLRTHMGDDPFESAYAEGHELSLDDAVEYARRGRGKRRRPSTGWDSLTPTELEVVKLVAEGLSNPQIAERMFISRKTVTTHLSHVFAKLDLPSRAGLSAEAVRHGVVSEKGAT